MSTAHAEPEGHEVMPSPHFVPPAAPSVSPLRRERETPAVSSSSTTSADSIANSFLNCCATADPSNVYPASL